jgi:carboxyl-terminal processing protease
VSRRAWLVAALAATALVDGAGHSAPADEPSFAAWRNRPREPFRDGTRSFEAVKKLLESTYVDPPSADELWRGAAEGMLARAGGRPWDQLLSPREFAEMRGQMKGEVVGVGVEIKFDPDSGLIQVKHVFPGSGAAAAGLAAGDVIVKVNGHGFQGQQYQDVVAALRGAAGSNVQVAVLRDDRVTVRSIRRAVVPFDQVSTLVLPAGVAVVAIRSFNERTPQELKAALGGLPSVRGIVLDLRHNPGGLLERMVDCAGMLLPAGTPVATLLERGGGQRRLVPTGGAMPVRRVVVLIDDATASGAEVLAGALREGLHARLVGKRTQGKWNVQQLHTLDNGWVVKLTIALIHTPAGVAPDGSGLAPDVPVEMAAAEVDKAQRLRDPALRLAADPQLATAVSLL